MFKKERIMPGNLLNSYSLYYMVSYMCAYLIIIKKNTKKILYNFEVLVYKNILKNLYFKKFYKNKYLKFIAFGN